MRPADLSRHELENAPRVVFGPWTFQGASTFNALATLAAGLACSGAAGTFSAGLTCSGGAVNLDGSGLLRFSSETGIQAAPNQGAVPLTKSLNRVTSSTGIGHGVTLPAAAAGLFCLVWNALGVTTRCWPASGDDCGAGVDTFVNLSAGTVALFFTLDTTTWCQK